MCPAPSFPLLPLPLLPRPSHPHSPRLHSTSQDLELPIRPHHRPSLTRGVRLTITRSSPLTQPHPPNAKPPAQMSGRPTKTVRGRNAVATASCASWVSTRRGTPRYAPSRSCFVLPPGSKLTLESYRAASQSSSSRDALCLCLSSLVQTARPSRGPTAGPSAPCLAAVPPPRLAR
ncbi:hypothetical protein DMC30DRAFT_115356 [Rhodotorula diobovata]|uniref:Uncharacterized protein n=1 Tax=Rhodotorula diobovata TaxID=5288 RepID=A0A5C5G0W2_9BASI|nr:hypothetical protein DMC30DRAFT_115356 [Rhodotorula diobovata]